MRRFRKLRLFILVILVVAVIAYVFRAETTTHIEPGSTLLIELEGDYIEASGSPWLAKFLGTDERSFAGLLTTFVLAARDDRIKEVVIVIRPLQIGWGKAGELRAAISRLKEAGRHTTAYLDMASMSGNLEYFVASASEEVYLTPAGTLPVLGLAARYLFLGGLFEKLGVGFDVGKGGKYKSAVETYTAEEMSPASREMANSLMDSLNEIFITGIMQGRGMSREEVVSAIDRGPMLGTELREAGLVDQVEYLDALLSDLDAPVVKESVYSTVQPDDVGFAPEATVALIYGTGTVVSGRSSQSRGRPVFASRTASEALQDAAEDPSIDAIILRVDSPGGSALASEHIWRSVEKVRNEGKPIVASFSDMAASGGYYASVAADEIVANPGALTGSIGVFAIRPIYDAALAKLGIETQSLTRGPHADFLVPGQPLTDSGRRRLQSLVLNIYTTFVERVADGRSLPMNRVEDVAQGRVWTGLQAQEVGLVDRLGGLHEAVDAVRERLGVDPKTDLQLVTFPPSRSFRDELLSFFQIQLSLMAFGNGSLREMFGPLQDWFGPLSLEEPLAISPLWVEMH